MRHAHALALLCTEYTDYTSPHTDGVSETRTRSHYTHYCMWGALHAPGGTAAVGRERVSGGGMVRSKSRERDTAASAVLRAVLGGGVMFTITV